MKPAIIFLICGSLMLFGCSSPPHHPKVFQVMIKDMKFVPEAVTVTKGDTIMWINQDMMAHDVTEQATKRWSSGPIPANGTWKMAVKDGAHYYCSIHTVMKGSIELE